MLQSKRDHAAQLEASLKKLQEQNGNFSLTVEDNNKLIECLQEQLANSNETKKKLEENWKKIMLF